MTLVIIFAALLILAACLYLIKNEKSQTTKDIVGPFKEGDGWVPKSAPLVTEPEEDKLITERESAIVKYEDATVEEKPIKTGRKKAATSQAKPRRNPQTRTTRKTAKQSD